MGVRRKNPLLNSEKRHETAVRQIGHAITAYLTVGSKKFYKVTILPTGNSLGYISLIPSKDEVSTSRKNVIADIDVGVAGKAAEEVFFGIDRTTSACAKQIEKAADLAYFYVRDMGMENEQLFLNSEQDQMSDTYKFKTDQVVHSILADSLKRVKSLLNT